MNWQKNWVSLNLLHAHQDSFYNECYAYERLIKKKINEKIVMHCYNYTTLSAEREVKLHQRFNIVFWNYFAKKMIKSIAEQQSFHAIIKKLLLKDYSFTEKVLNKMLQNVLRMQWLEIYLRNVLERNFKNELFVNFSCVMMKSHYLFDVRLKFQINIIQEENLQKL